MFCNARCGMVRLIHPNVAVMWNKVRRRVCAIRRDATCDVMQSDEIVKFGDAMWNNGVVHVEYGGVL